MIDDAEVKSLERVGIQAAKNLDQLRAAIPGDRVDPYDRVPIDRLLEIVDELDGAIDEVFHRCLEDMDSYGSVAEFVFFVTARVVLGKSADILTNTVQELSNVGLSMECDVQDILPQLRLDSERWDRLDAVVSADQAESAFILNAWESVWGEVTRRAKFLFSMERLVAAQRWIDEFAS